MRISSSAFAEGETIPIAHTCSGGDESPPLEWTAPPSGTHSLALVLDDPDAPGGLFTYWLAWGFPATSRGAGPGEPPPYEGRNDFGTVGYRGPCPPPGHGEHRYRLRLHALGGPLDLAAGSDRRRLDAALVGQVLQTAELTGRFARS